MAHGAKQKHTSQSPVDRANSKNSAAAGSMTGSDDCNRRTLMQRLSRWCSAILFHGLQYIQIRSSKRSKHVALHCWPSCRFPQS
mmetsp:Transcript_16933/g.29157  ORF Transcript_16933/g.29157 Transcript_16933/m.29157 type:complete len:84 (+) Transcript_16933:243-494(+)